MSQRSSVESPKFSQSPIKPALQGVLSSLDVKLEEELTRYRRNRRVEKQSAVNHRGASSIPPSIELIPVSTLSLESELLAAESETIYPQTTLQPEVTLSETTAPGPLTMATATEVITPSHPAVTAESRTASPQTYLQSSEALLKSIDEGSILEEERSERSLMSYLLTPLGIGSMFLILLSGVTLGYFLFPSGLTHLFKKSDPALVTENSVTTPPTTTVPNASAALPKAPNLVSKEFVDLNLDTLSNVQPKQSPLVLPTAKPSLPPAPKLLNPPVPPTSLPQPNAANPASNNEGINNLSTALIPQPNQPTTVQVVPSASAAASPKTPPAVGSPIRAADGLYYVVIDYTGEKSLEEVRKVVPDAYIQDRSSGTKIQVGALGDAASAALLVKELQGKGLNPQYYKP